MSELDGYCLTTTTVKKPPLSANSLSFTPITFSSSAVYHFLLDWDTRGYSIAVNGITVMQDGWDHWYEPPSLRVSLGCYPRADSFVGAVYRNILLKKKQ